MGEVWFYHLTDGAPELALSQLLARAGASGARIELRGRDAARMEKLDLDLWRRGDEDAFPAHGLAGGPHDALQPVLLTVAGQAAANDPAYLFTLDGAEVTADEAQALTRVLILFDGHDEDALQLARAQWRALTGAGLAAQYWAQEDGRWLKKMEKPASA